MTAIFLLDLNAFIKFYIDLYSENNYVALPLDFDERSTLTPGKNPAHKFCETAYWLAYKDNKVVGRIAAIISSNELQNSKTKIQINHNNKISAPPQSSYGARGMFKTVSDF